MKVNEKFEENKFCSPCVSKFGCSCVLARHTEKLSPLNGGSFFFLINTITLAIREIVTPTHRFVGVMNYLSTEVGPKKLIKMLSNSGHDMRKKAVFADTTRVVIKSAWSK